ncbi:MAG: SufS family cysteine desulfurase [Bacteroidales bacterium]|nr:SufS family cysteine desulfurase [Bacteroidales bacterium]
MENTAANFRKHFPALSQQVYGKPLVYFDNAATSQRPDCVIEMQQKMTGQACANVHRAVHRLALDATELYQQGREAAAAFIGAPADEIIFTSGTTAAINLVASCYTRICLNKGDRILITEAEHHSNLVPWQMACAIHGTKLLVTPVKEDGSIDMETYRKQLDNGVKLVAVAHMTNVLGVENPLKEIITAAHEAGAVVLVDGAQGIVHSRVDVKDLDCDFYAFSGHKIYAPTGIGVLYGKRELLEQMPPYMGGGDMVDRVSFEKTTYGPLPLKFEAGTQNISAAACLAPALKLAREAQEDAELQAAMNATDKLMAEQLGTIEGLHCPSLANPLRKGIFSFWIDGVHPTDAAEIMDKLGVAVRTGYMCAEPIIRKYTDNGMMRASLMPYNTQEEVQIFMEALRRALKMLR